MANASFMDTVKRFNSFSGCDMVCSVNAKLPDGTKVIQVIGSLMTLTTSTHMDKAPVRSLGNVNAKDYTYGPRTIAGTLIFAVFNQHWFHEMLINNGVSPSKMNYVMDELPPFDITITMENEYGKKAKMVIYGVRCVTEGITLATNDVYTENTYQYVATGYDYLTAITNSSGSKKTAANKGNSSSNTDGSVLNDAKSNNTGTNPVLQSNAVKANNKTIGDESKLTAQQKEILARRAAQIKENLKGKDGNT